MHFVPVLLVVMTEGNMEQGAIIEEDHGGGLCRDRVVMASVRFLKGNR